MLTTEVKVNPVNAQDSKTSLRGGSPSGSVSNLVQMGGACCQGRWGWRREWGWEYIWVGVGAGRDGGGGEVGMGVGVGMEVGVGVRWG